MHLTSKSTVEHQKTNKGFGVMPVKKLSFIKDLIINRFGRDAGLNSGFKKAIRSEDFQNFLDTAGLKSNKSKIIGLRNYQSGASTYLKFATSFTMALTLAKTTALFQS